jgi:tetratricopeptide (TPR) repeat protein
LGASSRIDELRQRYEENPRRFFAPLANEYRKVGGLEQAIALCRSHLDEAPGNLSGQIVLGQSLFDAGQYDSARVPFESAVALDQGNLIALRHLGDIARFLGDGEAAVSWYRRVLDADPWNDEVAALCREAAAMVAGVPSAATARARDAEPCLEPASVPCVGAGPDALSSSPPSLDSIALVPLFDAEPTEDEAFAGLPVRELSLGAVDDLAVHDVHIDTVAVLTGFELPASTLVLDDPLGGGAVHVAAAAPFATATMADLYLRQGLRGEAIAVYEQLIEARPDDDGLRAKLAALRAPEQAAAEPAAQAPTARGYFAALAARRAVPLRATTHDNPAVAADPPPTPGPAASDADFQRWLSALNTW